MSTEAESPQIAAAHRFVEELDTTRWAGGVKIVLQGAMRTTIKNGSVDMQSGWRADVFYGKGRKPAFVMVANSPAAVLRDVAMLTEGLTE